MRSIRMVLILTILFLMVVSVWAQTMAPISPLPKVSPPAAVSIPIQPRPTMAASPNEVSVPLPVPADQPKTMQEFFQYLGRLIISFLQNIVLPFVFSYLGLRLSVIFHSLMVKAQEKCKFERGDQIIATVDQRITPAIEKFYLTESKAILDAIQTGITDKEAGKNALKEIFTKAKPFALEAAAGLKEDVTKFFGNYESTVEHRMEIVYEKIKK